MEFLAAHRGEVVTRAQLYEHLFDENDSSMSNLLDVYVSTVRKSWVRNSSPRARRYGYCIEMNFHSIKWRLQAWHGFLLLLLVAGFDDGLLRIRAAGNDCRRWTTNCAKPAAAAAALAPPAGRGFPEAVSAVLANATVAPAPRR